MSTPRQRLRNAIFKTGTNDRITWCPNLAYFWEHQPQELQDKGQFWFMKEIGADPLLRGFVHGYKEEHIGATITYEDGEGYTNEIITTASGSIYTTHSYSPEGDTWFLTRHAVQTEEDYKVLQEYFQAKRITANQEEVSAWINEHGEEALCVPLGPQNKSSFQQLIEHWVGTEKLIYDLFDFPETVHETLRIMQEKSKEAAQALSKMKDAEVFIFWEDTSTTNYSPTMFQQYILPEIKEWAEILHEGGKYLIHHACGHLRHVLEYMNQENIDCIESISPPPTGNIELWEAREFLDDNVTLIGGIEPVHFVDLDGEELKDYVKHTLKMLDGTNFVLANSDSCPPEVTVEKMYLITEALNEYYEEKGKK